MKKIAAIILPVAISFVVGLNQHSIATAATVLEADFDSFSEGTIGFEFRTNGIQFSKFDPLFQDGHLGRFSVDSVTNEVWPPLSAPNYLGFSGFAPGPGPSFGRFSSMEMSVSQRAVSAQMDLFSGNGFYRLMTLTAYMDDVVVGTSTIDTRQATRLTNFATHNFISISGITLNRLRLSTTDFNGTPTFTVLGVDNVRFVVPEPNLHVTMLVSAVLTFGLSRQMRRRNN